jgi:hypothetical protein
MNDLETTTISIELNDFTKDELIKFIQLSDVWNQPINDVFVRIITEYTNNLELEDNSYNKTIVD